jgi:Cu2+-exporting ATPase
MAIAALCDLGISPQVLSGDGESIVASVADQCGVSEHFARRSPQEKLAHVQSMQQQGKRVAMVGDGVNDAPVLGGADVSIAMGRGAALSHATADLILVREDLTALPPAIAIARRTIKIARQNLVWSAAYNLGSLPLAALGYIPPWLAALGMSLSSVAVVLNAMRLLPGRRAAADAPSVAESSAASGIPSLATQARS